MAEDMLFRNRLAKEITEGVVRALLEDAKYRVIDSGIERVIRELSCLSAAEYKALDYPDAMSCLPDFTVMDRATSEKHLVEVKYRTDWDGSVLTDASVRRQVEIFGKIVLVSAFAKAPDPRGIDGPSRNLRCCTLRLREGVYEVELWKAKKGFWQAVDQVIELNDLWWRMTPLDVKFPLLKQRAADKTVGHAVRTLAGIFDRGAA